MDFKTEEILPPLRTELILTKNGKEYEGVFIEKIDFVREGKLTKGVPELWRQKKGMVLTEQRKDFQ